MSDIRQYPFIRLNDPSIDRELSQEASKVIHSGRYLGGPQTLAFEQELAQTLQSPIAIGTSNGLDALRLIFRAYIENGKLRPGQEVIVPANTYIASILPLTEYGLRPVACEPDPETMNLDFKAADSLVNSRTGAIMLVHLYGTPCWDRPTAMRWSQAGILLIEDNAQAIGAMASQPGLNGDSRMTGSLGNASAQSFYPTKNIGALGDAGAVTTSDPELARTIRALANYGSDRRYHNIYQGYNCRLDEIQASILRVKLRRLRLIHEHRRMIAHTYESEIRNPAIIRPRIFKEMTQVWHQYIVRTEHRDRFRKYLEEHGVMTDIHYATPPHLQPCYASRFYDPLPLTEHMAATMVSLPIASITASEATEVSKIINNFS